MRHVRMPSGRAFIGAWLHRALLVGAGVTAISLTLSSAALATTTIDTTTPPHWNGSSSVSGFGYPGVGSGHGTATFGQTVTVPATDTTLDSFTFEMKLPTGLLFRGEVYAWDNAAHHATGTALYESGPTHTTNASAFQPITFNTGGINLTAGAHYVLFASISGDYAADAMPPPNGAGRGSWGLIPLNSPGGPDPYPGGDFFFLNNGGDTSQWTTTTWGSEAPLDLAFKASFSSPDHDLALAQPSDLTGANAVNATSPAGAVVTYTNPVASDESLSTVTVSCLPASGSTFAIGDTTVTCTATDTDGDKNSPVQNSFNVHVKGAAEQLSDLANAVTGVGPGTSLADKVASVQSDLAANDTGDACGTLNAFINEVNAQTGKHIKADMAASLIDAAQRIEAVIPCRS